MLFQILALLVLSVLCFVVASILKAKHFYTSLAFYTLSILLPIISIYIAPTNLSAGYFIAKTLAVILSICFTILGLILGLDFDVSIKELKTCSVTVLFGSYIILILCVLLSLFLLGMNSNYLEPKSIEASYDLHSVKLTSRVEGEIDGNFIHTEGTISEPDKISIYYFDNNELKVYTTDFNGVKINIVESFENESFTVKVTKQYEEKFLYGYKITTITHTSYSYNVYVTNKKIS